MYRDYLTAIKSAPGGLVFNKATKIAMRHAVPLYVTPDPLFVTPDDPIATPVAWTVGQQHIESLPDRDMESTWVGSTCWLSSIQFTPQKQLGIIGRDVPTWSYSLYGFDKFNANYDSLSALQHASHPDGTPGGANELSSFDVLLKHKVKHPYVDTGIP